VTRSWWWLQILPYIRTKLNDLIFEWKKENLVHNDTRKLRRLEFLSKIIFESDQLVVASNSSFYHN